MIRGEREAEKERHRVVGETEKEEETEFKRCVFEKRRMGWEWRLSTVATGKILY